LKAQRQPIRLTKPGVVTSILDKIDFSDRFFKKEHHWPFRKEAWYKDDKWTKDDREYVEERKISRKRFEQLDKLIYRQFHLHGLQTLKPNPAPEHLISTIHQIDPSKPRALDAMWLSYGKSEKEISQYQKMVSEEQKPKQTFIHHARLQIRIELEHIGIWLLFAKENEGGIFDRDYFKRRMEEPVYRDWFYSELKKLPAEYFISVGGDKRDCYTFPSADKLHEFCLSDNLSEYFIIGRNYKIADPEMSEANLPIETVRVFKLLFPFYEKMKHQFER
jgi:hypothetical protein